MQTYGWQMPSKYALLVPAILIATSVGFSQESPKQKVTEKSKEPPSPKTLRIPEYTPLYAPAMAFTALDDRMEITKLKPAIFVPNLCVYRYRASTTSSECQKFLDQAMGYYYSYVWIETARSAETALKHDPNCAYAWLIMHKGLEKWGRDADATKALKKAQELMPKASHREQLLIKAKLLEKGILNPSASFADRKKAAATELDNMLVIYDEDEEAWYSRAILGGFQGSSSEAVPFHKALLKINPIHPGANHELVHFYENTQRPALGWPYAEGYIASSPGLPHAFHMQSHLATRIGKWEKTADRSWRAIELQLEYHKSQGVQHHEDHQFAHHLEILTLGLVHDGRFAEAAEIKKESEKYNYKFLMPWFRMQLFRENWEEAEKMIASERKSDKNMGSYLAALMYLEKGDTVKAAAEVDVLRLSQQKKKGDRRLEQRLWETQGRLMCQTGDGEGGIKLLQRIVDKTKGDYYHHSWGGGAYYMESWGVGALEVGNWEVAEEAFLEALAHDPGSVIGSLGMQVICEKQGRSQEAQRFSELARKLWSKADSKDYTRLYERLMSKAGASSIGTHAPTDAK